MRPSQCALWMERLGASGRGGSILGVGMLPLTVEASLVASATIRLKLKSASTPAHCRTVLRGRGSWGSGPAGRAEDSSAASRAHGRGGTPHMPPKDQRCPEDQIGVIRTWMSHNDLLLASMAVSG